MNSHKNARLTYLRRLEMVQEITERGVSAPEAAARHGVSAVSARKWLGRYLAGGAAALLDKSSLPERSGWPWRSSNCAASSLCRPASRATWASPRRLSAACSGAPNSRGSATCNRRNRYSATSAKHPANSCTSTSRISVALTRWAIASPANTGSEAGTAAGRPYSWPSTDVPPFSVAVGFRVRG